jgi:transcriptional regulator with XRE-family HTH domain
MGRRSILELARNAQGLTQEAVARRCGTSQPTLSAYERGTKSPTLAVAERILRVLGYEIGLNPRVTFREVPIGDDDRMFLVPDRLWRVDPPECFAPLTLSSPYGGRKTFDMTNPRERAVAYAWLIRDGSEEQLINHLDGALLAGAWNDVRPHLAQPVIIEWEPLITQATEGWLGPLMRAVMQRWKQAGY